MSQRIKICFATSNKGKLQEVRNLLGDKYHVIDLEELGCTEDIPETGTSLEENANLKAKYLWERYGLSCFADDSGLEVKALNNAPGLYSARYAGTGKSEDNIKLLLQNLANQTDKSARFKTVITLVLDGVFHHFEGIAEGKIITEARGNAGFGYDPIFVPEGYELTFAQMGMEEKNAISHRGKAIRKLIQFLKTNA